MPPTAEGTLHFLSWGIFMCGIAGFCDFNADFLEGAEAWTQILTGMRTVIAHRRHDQTGVYLRHNVGLAHTRLSSWDLAGGVQPMVCRQGRWESGIVYNGGDLQRGGVETGLVPLWVSLLDYL